MTHDELKILCHEWQERLRLTDWRVEIHFVPLYEDWGGCVMDLKKKQAHIYIRDQAYAPTVREQSSGSFSAIEEEFFHEDEETVLVHELLHLMFRPFDKTADDSLEDKCLEFACTSLSVALVELKRKGEVNA